MKGFSILPAQTIRNHQTNNSFSKTAYQFPKQKRFPECKIAFYANDSQLSNRKTIFGYGTKSDFTKDRTGSPGSTKYYHKSVFDQSKSRGLSFGLSRESSPDRSYLIPQIFKHPGPGKYENQIQTRMCQSFTMRPRTIDFIQEKKTNKNGPSPSSYNSIDLDPKNGRFAVAKFKDTKFGKISLDRRFPEAKQYPGPLSYKQGDSLSTNARYILSQHKGNGTRPFPQTARTTFTQSVAAREKKYPGPGYYEQSTEFGVYGDSRYYKTLKSTIDSK